MSDRPTEPRRPRLPPVAYPVLGLVLGGILVFSFSRVLLAVSKDYAVVIALLLAVNILIGAALVASGARVRRRPASFPLLVVGGLAIVGVGLLALNLKEKPVEAGGAEKPLRVALAAQNIKFDPTTLSFPAGAKVSMSFDNKDSGTPHNFVLTADEAQANILFKGQLVTGPATITYAFTAPPKPGTYFFHCEVHPTQMKGTVTVTAGGAPGGGEAGGGGGGAPGALDLTAQGIAFQPGQLSAPGGGQITIHFDNKDAGTPHNVAVFKGSDATAPVLFRGDIITGPATKDYTFPAPPPGSYYFHCDVHPQQMTGTLVVK